ncbi:sugar ABC transporter substrate-binding protein [Synergistales bacterium]|nr:sugar ABC transporter substrate-binding protein [Synergistales bacterium]
MKKVILLLVVFVALAVTAAVYLRSSDKTVGVCMPMRAVDRWMLDGDNIKKQLEAKGYKVILEYAENDNERQRAQIENMIDRRCSALIIAAADCYGLNDVLEKARKNDIKIIAYDRLLMQTEFVDYYCTFDNFEVGAVQGEYIEKAFNLKDAAPESANIEIVSGAADDSCAVENYNGQMSVLKPYIDGGKIKVFSGETGFEPTAIADWSSEGAKNYMKNLLSKYYADGAQLDAVLSANDSMARGVIEALEEAGYGSKDKPWPVITGQDCDKENVTAMIKGVQSMSLFIDTRALATRAVDLTDDILLGKTPTINNATRYDNEVKIVPASICKPIYVDKNNYSEVLVRSGYYKREDFTE